MVMRLGCSNETQLWHSNWITVHVNWCMHHIYWVSISMEGYDHEFYEQHPTYILTMYVCTGIQTPEIVVMLDMHSCIKHLHDS